MRHQHCDYSNLCPAVLLDNDATHIFDFDLKIRSNLDGDAAGNLIFTQWHGTPSRKYFANCFLNDALLVALAANHEGTWARQPIRARALIDETSFFFRAQDERCERLHSKDSVQ